MEHFETSTYKSDTKDPYCNYNSAFLHMGPEDDLTVMASTLNGMDVSGYRCQVQVATPYEESYL